MNTYHKYCENTFLAKTKEKFDKDDIITIVSRGGLEKEHIIHNFIHEDKDGFNFYSIVRADEFNVNVKRENKAKKYEEWSSKATDQSGAIQ